MPRARRVSRRTPPASPSRSTTSRSGCSARSGASSTAGGRRRRWWRMVHTERSVMSEFEEVEREEIAVQFIRVPDGLEHIRRAWDELEAVVPLRGRHFYGAFDPVANDYRACVELRDGDELVSGLEN